MALPDLTGLNIEDTYQRVLHTDGASVYDGTGSLVILQYTGSFTGDGSGLTGITAVAAPAGPYKSIQFNDSGTTSGSGNFTFDKSTNTVTLSGSLLVDQSIDSANRILYDSNNARSVDWQARYAVNSYNDETIDWENGILLDPASNAYSVDWTNRSLIDSNKFGAANWDSRTLYGPDGSSVLLDWNSNTSATLTGTSSWANNSITASFINGGTF